VGARKVLRWPDGWMIEDVVCWILQADEAAAMQRVNADLAAAPGDCATLLARLKLEDRAQEGWPQALDMRSRRKNSTMKHAPSPARF
jgi:hypothetical protein